MDKNPEIKEEAESVRLTNTDSTTVGDSQPPQVTDENGVLDTGKEQDPSNSVPTSSNSVPTKQWGTSLGHRLFTLAGSTFLLFELIFLNLYADGSSWFSIDLSPYGVLVVLVLLPVVHFLLRLVESQRGCQAAQPIWKGKPAVCYWRWLKVSDSGITYGIKHIRWEAIDELELSWFGNLIFRSRVICGDEEARPDIVMKFPYSSGNAEEKNELIALIRRKRPSVVLNKKLADSISSPIVKGQNMMQTVTSSIMLVVLLDVGYSSFCYLELLKNYYQAGLAATAARGEIYDVDVEANSKAQINPIVSEAEKRSAEENMQLARRYFERAEYLSSHPVPFSWVSSKLINDSNVAAGIHQERSNVLWLLGERQKAIAEAQKALKLQPKNLRFEMRLARLYAENNEPVKAMEQLKVIMEDHESSLLPRLYRLALLKEQKSTEEMKAEYIRELDECYANTYGIEPWWPPGGDRFFTELFFSKDVRFVFDRLMDKNSNPKLRQSKKT